MAASTVKCAASGEIFLVTEADLDFYRSIDVPSPRLSPIERQRRRASHRNFRSLYHRSCSATGQRLISMYHNEQPFPVYSQDYWWSDSWNALQYGRPYDFNQNFFNQYFALSNSVPHFSTLVVRSENCLYTNQCLDSKNCYLVFGCVRNEDCLYGHIVWQSEHCVDNLYLYRCQWCSNCVDVVDSYDLHYSIECASCQNSYFLFDCRGCSNCFGGINLRNKEYCFLGQQLTREEYKRKLSGVIPLSASERDRMNDWLLSNMRTKAVFPELFGLKNEDVTGNHIYESSTSNFCFDAKKVELCSYCFTVESLYRCLDVSFSGAGESRFCYDCISVNQCENVSFCHNLRGCHDCMYCEYCFDSHHLFGCYGLRHAQFCIFNIQYNEDAYYELRASIVEQMRKQGDWGEFFPSQHSPFAYNESIVNEYQPLSEVEARARGLKWCQTASAVSESKQATLIPHLVSSLSDDAIRSEFKCVQSGKPYKITRQELEFYRRSAIAPPTLCPDLRHEQRMKIRANRNLTAGCCSKCGTNIMSAHFGDADHKTFCQKCYLEVIHS